MGARRIGGKRDSTNSKYVNINTIVDHNRTKNKIEVTENIKKRVTQQPNVPKFKMSNEYVVQVNNDKNILTQIEQYNVKEDSDEDEEDESVSGFESEPFETDNTSNNQKRGK